MKTSSTSPARDPISSAFFLRVQPNFELVGSRIRRKQNKSLQGLCKVGTEKKKIETAFVQSIPQTTALTHRVIGVVSSNICSVECLKRESWLTKPSTCQRASLITLLLK